MAKLTTLQRRVEKLKAAIDRAESKRRRQLLALPKKYGFASIDEVIAALQELSGGKSRRTFRKANGRQGRAKITDAMREKVKALAAAGKTGGEIARAVGLSIASVQSIKKAAGLVKARK